MEFAKYRLLDKVKFFAYDSPKNFIDILEDSPIEKTGYIVGIECIGGDADKLIYYILDETCEISEKSYEIDKYILKYSICLNEDIIELQEHGRYSKDYCTMCRMKKFPISCTICNYNNKSRIKREEEDKLYISIGDIYRFHKNMFLVYGIYNSNFYGEILSNFHPFIYPFDIVRRKRYLDVIKNCDCDIVDKNLCYGITYAFKSMIGVLDFINTYRSPLILSRVLDQKFSKEINNLFSFKNCFNPLKLKRSFYTVLKMQEVYPNNIILKANYKDEICEICLIKDCNDCKLWKGN